MTFTFVLDVFGRRFSVSLAKPAEDDDDSYSLSATLEQSDDDEEQPLALGFR